jgi:hypothetical protein
VELPDEQCARVARTAPTRASWSRHVTADGTATKVQHHFPLPEPARRERTTAELLDLLARSASGEQFAIRSARNARVSPAHRRHVKEIS